MISVNAARRDERRREINRLLFWTERLFLFAILVFPTRVSDPIFSLLVLVSTSTHLASPLCPNLFSIGPSGIGGFWLFLLDRSTFYLGLEYSKLLARGFELAFVWHFTVFLSAVIHSFYIADHLLRPFKPQPREYRDETPISAGDVSTVVEKVKELVEDGKKLITDMDYTIHSGLETLRKEWGVVFREDEKKILTQIDVVKHMICLQLGTLRDNIRLNVDEIRAELLDELRSKVYEDIIGSGLGFNKHASSVANHLREAYLAVEETANEAKTTADQLRETYHVIQKTAKEAKITADKANEMYLTLQENQRPRMTRGEDVEGFVELREEVRRMSVETEIAVEELSRATVELVEAGFQQWEEDNADYLASLPLLYSNHS